MSSPDPETPERLRPASRPADHLGPVLGRDRPGGHQRQRGRRSDTGDAVRRAQRALRRSPNTTLEVDGEFGPLTEEATRQFQAQEGLPVTGVVDEATWAALPTGDPMPVLSEGSTGPAVRSLQEVLTRGAPGLWETTPLGVDGVFGANTGTSVRAFQTWARIGVDGIVGQQTWDAATSLEFMVGLQHTLKE
jgi:peptidoglycan hydrolase-like protein with peptidoglycan-binding domain